MNLFEKKMVDKLIDLKENHHIVGVKAEFEAEGTRKEEALRLKEVVTRAGLDLTIKIGGCEAIKDMYDARVIGVSKVVAPMIESAYALKKYLSAIQFVFPLDVYEETKFLINIETITAYNNIDEMLSLPESKNLHGIVFGRADMTGSMNISRELVNSEEIFTIAKKIALKAQKHNLEFIIGGEVSAHSLPFFKALPEKTLNKFETRKIIFDAPKALIDKNADKGILKALEFELMWLKNKHDFYGMIYSKDEQRFAILESRYNKSIEII